MDDIGFINTTREDSTKRRNADDDRNWNFHHFLIPSFIKRFVQFFCFHINPCSRKLSISFQISNPIMAMTRRVNFQQAFLLAVFCMASRLANDTAFALPRLVFPEFNNETHAFVPPNFNSSGNWGFYTPIVPRANETLYQLTDDNSHLPESQLSLHSDISRDSGYLWPDGVIVYEWDSTDETFRSVMIDAMQTITAETTYLTFREKLPTDSHAVLYTQSSSGCFAYLGKNALKLNLGPGGCVHKGVAMHELMHVAGRHHIQMRGDRDDFVTINFENIREGKEGNFAKISLTNSFYDHSLPYDYGSIMHCKYCKSPHVE